MSQREQDSYSITNAIKASLNNDWSGAGLEQEVSRTIAQQLGRSAAPGGFFLPANLQMRAPYAVGAPSTGGALVATNLLAANFIDALVAKLAVAQAGATVLGGLVGNVELPRKTAKTTAAWIAEGGTLTESEATFDKVSLTPKVVGCYSRYSRLTIQQTTPEIEFIVRNDLAEVMARAIDLAALSGTGTNAQPTGILNQSGVNSVAMGTNGGAVTLEAMLDLRAAIANANVDPSQGRFIVNTRTETALLKLKTSGSGEYLFSTEGSMAGPAGMAVTSIAGCPVIVSNQLASNGTKGTGTNLSTAVFGVFSEALLGQWGALEILPNPYGAGYTKGEVEIRAMQTVDFAVRHGEAFAKVTDLIA